MGINGILADEMGLGKTIQTISLLAYINLLNKEIINKKIIHTVIVPKITIKNWLKEMNKWLPELRVLYFYGNKDERRKLVEDDINKKDYDVILTTFECAMKEKTALSKINFDCLIIDEAHRLKNEKGKFSNIVRKFKCEHRLLLTGTPLQNNLHELWALLNFLMPNVMKF
jgi:SWI/SNF-related matrix-associated actin-dependent regulator of chromatin subfamily A member 5